MKTLFGTLLLLLVAASATLIAVRNPGYVLITREPYVLNHSVECEEFDEPAPTRIEPESPRARYGA